VRLIESRYLDDGKGFNHGQPARLIEIEEPADFDAILERIASTGFYDQHYYEERAGQRDDRLTAHFWWVAELVNRLRPTRVLEIGCGRGDVLRLLHDVHKVESWGIDMGVDAKGRVWPALRATFRDGDIAAVLDHWDGPKFDTVCAFDIWEHLHPLRLDEYISAVIGATTDDALFAFVIPAYGLDDVFGEPFPLDFEENRAAFEERRPFPFLYADDDDPAIPAAGHLVYAHTDFWVGTFRRHGLVRVPDVERDVHKWIDALVPHSIRSFYVLRRDTEAAAARARTIARRRWSDVWFVRSLLACRREMRKGLTFDQPLLATAKAWFVSRPGVVPALARARLRRTHAR
jgi:SAM-dependent methyltransferase